MAPAEANASVFHFSLLSPIFSGKAGGDEPFAFYSPTEVLDFGFQCKAKLEKNYKWIFWIATSDGWITWFRLSALRVWVSVVQQTAKGAWIDTLKRKGPKGPVDDAIFIVHRKK